MSILVLGKDGQLGCSLFKELSNLDKIYFIGRQDIDLTKTAIIQKKISLYQPHIIINAAAYTSVESAEFSPDIAFKVNSDAVFELAQYSNNNDCILYHYSTDYVFDGLKNEPYVESDHPNPINIYGTSKYEGEQHIINSGCKYYIYRTSWVYSETGNNFVKKILNLIQQNKSLKIINDQFGTPTSSNFIANITKKTLKTNLPFGLYHLTPNGVTSWYEYASFIIKQIYGPEIIQKLEPISHKDYLSKVKRPLYSKLDSTLLSKRLNLIFPNWLDVITAELNKFK